MAVYNHEKYIRQAIEGVLMQKTDFEIELLIHEDASTDDSATIIREYEKAFPDIIKPIYQTENQHSKENSISWTYIYPKAKGKYIALCEGDDYWTDPNKLQIQVDYLENHPEYSMCFHAADKVNEEGKLIELIQPSTDEFSYTVLDLLTTDDHCTTATMVFRKKFIGKKPEFFSKCSVGDYPMKLLLASFGELRYIPKNMAAYRYNHTGSWTEKTFFSKDSKQKVSQLKRSTIATLISFNDYTEQKYNEVIADEIKWIEYTELYPVINRKKLMKSIHNGRFRYKLSQMNKKQKMSFFMRLYIPRTFAIMGKIKALLKM